MINFETSYGFITITTIPILIISYARVMILSRLDEIVKKKRFK